ncbi:phage tail protein [Vibrio cholerae]|nr:phage tail protein [Vibrio cholerae]
MANNPQNLLFHIDVDELNAIQQQLGATEAQLRASYNRALSRTAVTIRALTNRLIRDHMQVKSMKTIRKRIQQFRLRSPSKQRDLDELRLWFGLNDVPVGYLRGRIVGGQSSGATFQPRGKLAKQHYDRGFVAQRYGRKSIFTRVSEGKFPIKEARVPVAESLQVTIEDEIFDLIPDIFLKHFQTDLKGRVKMGLNRKNWHE